jgi:pimeloyl-ACP methyl ester carboxylesterase
LTGNFYGSQELFEYIIEEGNVALASFNNRGHDMIAGTKKINPSLPKGYEYFSCGAGQEEFEDSVFDIDAGMSFLTGCGYKNIILAGHSTGANKVCFYAGTKKDPRVTGVILASPISDRLGAEKRDPNISKTLRDMQSRIDKGKGDELLTGFGFFPITPKRYVSLYSDQSAEDVFDYDENHGKLAAFSKITQPLLVVLSEKDEHADRPVVSMKKMFDAKTKSSSYSSVIMENATHGYDGQEKEFATLLTNWIAFL